MGPKVKSNPKAKIMTSIDISAIVAGLGEVLANGKDLSLIH